MYGVVLIVVLLFQQINSEVDFIREKEIGFDCVYFGVSSLAISLKVSVLWSIVRGKQLLNIDIVLP